MAFAAGFTCRMRCNDGRSCQVRRLASDRISRWCSRTYITHDERQIIKKKEKPLAHRSELNERDKENFLKEEEASAEAAADVVIAENEK